MTLATEEHYKYADQIAYAISESAAERGIDAPARTACYILDKMKKGLAVIATDLRNSEWMGFSYIEVWSHRRYIANSGLFVPVKFRGIGVSKEIKNKVFELSRTRFPYARMFSLSASPAVIQSNIDLGFKEIPHHEILEDPWFVTGCQSWVDYVDLMSRTDDVLQHLAMIYDPVEEAVELPLIPENEAESQEISEKIRASR